MSAPKLIELDRRNSVIIADMDDVLVNISPKWFCLMHENWHLFDDYMEDPGPLTSAQVYARDNYDIMHWLWTGRRRPGQPEVSPRSVREDFYRLYSEGDFYADLSPTPMASCLRIAAMQSFVKRIFVISGTVPGTERSKLAFFKRHFGDITKAEIILVAGRGSKAAVIRKEGIKYNVFIEDNPRNLVDVMENTESALREFLVPSFGYNRPEHCPELLAAVSAHNCALMSYENVG